MSELWFFIPTSSIRCLNSGIDEGFDTVKWESFRIIRRRIQNSLFLVQALKHPRNIDEVDFRVSLSKLSTVQKFFSE
jgi:hypothetical protein